MNERDSASFKNALTVTAKLQPFSEIVNIEECLGDLAQLAHSFQMSEEVTGMLDEMSKIATNVLSNKIRILVEWEEEWTKLPERTDNA